MHYTSILLLVSLWFTPLVRGQYSQCVKDEYSAELIRNKNCQACPPDSKTQFAGAKYIRQCICDTGDDIAAAVNTDISCNSALNCQCRPSTILTNGVITDGEGYYDKDSQCTWLIYSNVAIHLQFTHLELRNQDYVIVNRCNSPSCAQKQELTRATNGGGPTNAGGALTGSNTEVFNGALFSTTIDYPFLQIRLQPTGLGSRRSEEGFAANWWTSGDAFSCPLCPIGSYRRQKFKGVLDGSYCLYFVASGTYVEFENRVLNGARVYKRTVSPDMYLFKILNGGEHYVISRTLDEDGIYWKQPTTDTDIRNLKRMSQWCSVNGAWFEREKMTPSADGAECVSCPDNSISLPTSTGIMSCKCNVGWTGQDGSGCTECVSGKYKSSTGSSACLNCPDNSISDPAGTVIMSCKCNAGWTGQDGAECMQCASAKYKSSIGSSDCLTCPDNSISNTASTIKTSCKCNAGWTGQDGGECRQCPSGKYKSEIGNSACLPCPDNSISDPASIAITSCDCILGYGGPPEGPCIQCTTGKFQMIST